MYSCIVVWAWRRGFFPVGAAQPSRSIRQNALDRFLHLGPMGALTSAGEFQPVADGRSGIRVPAGGSDGVSRRRITLGDEIAARTKTIGYHASPNHAWC